MLFLVFAGVVVSSVTAALDRPGVTNFTLNSVNTTSFGPAWMDAIVSTEVDFVYCDGPYALCFYANCTAREEGATPWAPGLAMANCPCETYHGLYAVDLNGILDEASWRASRERCPLGVLSCPKPNTAPVCGRINSNSLYQGAPGLDAITHISAYSGKNASAHGGSGIVFPETTDCTGTPGTYASCMTAPCTTTEQGTTCQCPVATGPYQVGGKDKWCGGIPSASYQVQADETGTQYSLVPDGCSAKEPVCYQGAIQAMTSVLQEDTINCPGQNASKLVRGTCLDYGYGLHLGRDPLFRAANIYAKRPPLAPTDFLERCESRSRKYRAPPGSSALIITTSHSVLGPSNCTSCKPTGVASPEFTAPFYIFRDAGMNVTLASIQGGEIPIDTEARFMTHWDTRFWNDHEAALLTVNSPSVAELDFTAFDIVYMAGGWGAAWDLGTSDELRDGITAANAAGKVLGSVCHGALGFIQAATPEGGGVLVEGRNMTAVTNRQIEQLGIASITPLHPETELREKGANYFASHGVVTDIDQSMVVVDGRLVTGQNQNSACETAQRMLDQLSH